MGVEKMKRKGAAAVSRGAFNAFLLRCKSDIVDPVRCISPETAFDKPELRPLTHRFVFVMS